MHLPVLVNNKYQNNSTTSFVENIVNKRYAVAQLVEALRYKPEGRGFDFRWCHWNFSLT